MMVGFCPFAPHASDDGKLVGLILWIPTTQWDILPTQFIFWFSSQHLHSGLATYGGCLGPYVKKMEIKRK